MVSFTDFVAALIMSRIELSPASGSCTSVKLPADAATGVLDGPETADSPVPQPVTTKLSAAAAVIQVGARN